MAPSASTSGPDNTPPPDGDVDKGPMVLALVTVSTGLALLTVALRLFVRITVVKSVGWDDHAIVVSAILGALVMVFAILSVVHGNGRHMYFLDPVELIEASKWSRATIPPNLASCMLARVSLCLFLMRIVGGIRKYKIFLWSVIGITVLTTAACIINLLISCRPLERLWNPKAPGVCFPPSTSVILGSIQASTSITSDWLVALFPILILRKLHMARRTKFVLCILMGMGMFVGAAALVKTFQLYTLGKRVDVTWDTLSLTFWSIFEQNVSIIAVSVPAIRPLFSRYFRIGSQKNSNDQNPNYYLGYDNSNPTTLNKYPNSTRGKKRGPHAFSAAFHSTVSARDNTPPPPPLAMSDNDKDDYEGSQSSLVGEPKRSNNMITKTVSVGVYSSDNVDSYQAPRGGRYYAARKKSDTDRSDMEGGRGY